MIVFRMFALLLCAAAASSAASLPPGLSRYNPAGLSKDWVYEGTAFRSLRVPEAGSVRVLRLHHPRRGYLYILEGAEAASAEKTGFVREGTAFDAPAKDGVPVHRFKNAAGEFFFTPDLEEGRRAGLSDEGVAFEACGPQDSSRCVDVARYRNKTSGLSLLTAANESPYQVGAFYFGSFSPSARAIIEGTERVYGRRDDWWGGVRDMGLKPAIGYYDQRSVSVLEKHIRQASDAGLSFFSFYWYWSVKNRGERQGESLQSFLKARNSASLKFNLSLYAHPWDDDMAVDPSNEARVAGRLAAYFARPNYLRLPDGRPVFVIGDDRNIRDSVGKKCADANCSIAALGRFLAALKKASLKSVGAAPFVQIQAGSPGWESVPETDGVTCLIPPGVTIQNGSPYPKLDETVYLPLSRTGKPVSPCMLENFDERPRQDILIKDRALIRYLTGKIPALFRRNLTVAKDFSDAAYARERNPASRIIYLYAWNEWHEGGILEPNSKTGAQDLNVVTDVFSLPRLASPCLDKGACD